MYLAFLIVFLHRQFFFRIVLFVAYNVVRYKDMSPSYNIRFRLQRYNYFLNYARGTSKKRINFGNDIHVDPTP